MNTPAQRAWWQRPNRVLLINLREGDEPRIDPDRLIEEVQSFSATAFCINGGGIVAFYQTQLPDHPKSAGLNGRDLLAELVPRAHAQGLHVLARIDPSCAPPALAAAHPDWFARDRNGAFYAVNDFYVTCPNAGYYHGRMAEVVTEILLRYNADGIWNNQGKFAAWDTDGCFCTTCRTLFRTNDTIAGQVQVSFASTPGAMGPVKSGRLKAIAVTSPQRISALPEVPTIAESGIPGYEASVWYGIVAPARTPRDIIQKLNAEIAKILRERSHRERIAASDFEPSGSTPAEFGEFIRSETVKWSKVIKASGARAD